MRRSIPLLATACLLAAFAAPAQAQSNANADICAADDDSAFSPEQRIAACTALIEAAKDRPQDLAAALVNRGAAYWYANKMQRAFADLDRAIALDPKNARAFRERSNANRSSGRLDRALATPTRRCGSIPTTRKPSTSAATCSTTTGNTTAPSRTITKRCGSIRNSRKPSWIAASPIISRQDYQAAIKDYDESIKLNPKHARAYTNRGAAYKKLGMDERALADESAAIKLDPTVPEYFDNRGLSYQKNGDYDRAIADYDEAIRIEPKANFLTNRGDSYQFKGEFDRAIADYDRAIKLNPGFYLAYNNRGAAYRKKGDLDRAIENYEQALRVNPRFDTAAENLADVRQERDRRDSLASAPMLPTFDCDTARRAVEKAICSDPDLIRLDRQIDDAYKAALGKLDRAGIARLRREQRQFNVTRDKSFGRPDYQLKREMERRLMRAARQ